MNVSELSGFPFEPDPIDAGRKVTPGLLQGYTYAITMRYSGIVHTGCLREP